MSNPITSVLKRVHITPNGKWRVRIRKNGKPIHFGIFDSYEDAVKTAKKAYQDLYGEYASC